MARRTLESTGVDPSAGPPLDEEHRDSGPAAFRLAIDALARLKAYDVLASIVLDAAGRPTIRWWPVAAALERTGSDRARTALLAFAQDPDPVSRAHAAAGLSVLTDPSVGSALAALASDPEPFVAVNALRGLAKRADPSMAPMLTRLVLDRSRPPAVRSEAILALGAVVTRRILVQWGITGTGIVTMALVTVSLLTMLLLEADSPTWLVIGLPCLYAAAATSAGIPVTNAIMDTAPPGEASNVAAFRGAAALLGGAIGVALMSALVFGVVSTSLATELRREGQDNSRSDQIAASMRDGATSEDVAAQYSVPVADVDQISEAQAVAMVDGFHAFALASAACTALALAVFVGARHRDRPRTGAAS